ncbi:MAG: Crp/Fnr family transcriptional regulator [Proteobacteria bacterium]|nr:Crp/Fnr family transcriptional regulator [Pseudomonadota bacterium]
MLNIPNRSKDCSKCESRKENVFCDLPEAALEILSKNKVVNSFKRGQFIFYAGNYPSGLYCINSGVVKLESEGPSGNGHILRVVQSGGVLGYRSLFAEEPYEASAVVQENATVCLIPKSSIVELIQKFPDLGLKFLSYISKELRSAEQRLCGQTDKNASERIAEALLFLKDKFADQTWTRKDIAEWAGTTPETVMRSLADFEDEGVIEQTGRKIEIKNRAKLIDLANLSL